MKEELRPHGKYSAPIFDALKNHPELLADHTKIFEIPFKRGQYIYNAMGSANYLYAVLKGVVTLQKNTLDGNISTFYRASSGVSPSIFGIEAVRKQLQPDLKEELEYDSHAVPLGDCVIARFDAGAIVETLIDGLNSAKPASNGHFDPFPMYFINQLAQIEQKSRAIQFDLLTKSLTNRIAALLLELRSSLGDELPIYHQDIADALMTFRETVSSILPEFQSKDVIKQGQGRITICDLTALEQLAMTDQNTYHFNRKRRELPKSPLQE